MGCRRNLGDWLGDPTGERLCLWLITSSDKLYTIFGPCLVSFTTRCVLSKFSWLCVTPEVKFDVRTSILCGTLRCPVESTTVTLCRLGNSSSSSLNKSSFSLTELRPESFVIFELLRASGYFLGNVFSVDLIDIWWFSFWFWAGIFITSVCDVSRLDTLMSVVCLATVLGGWSSSVMTGSLELMTSDLSTKLSTWHFLK